MWPRRMSRLVVVAVVLSFVALAGTLAVLPAVAPARAANAPTPGAPTVAIHSPTIAAAPAPHSAAAASLARASLGRSVLDRLEKAGVPARAIYLPNFEGGGVLHGNVVAPITRVAPAPMGLGDFGVRNTTGTPHPYVIDSTSWEGTITLNSGDFFYIDNDGPDTFGVQLNAVLSNVTVYGTTNNDFWIQDVMFFTPSTSSIQMIDNIWNLSTPSTAEPPSTFLAGHYNGTPTGSYYYDLGPTFTTGFPFTAHLYENASTTMLAGVPYSTVRFGYDIVSGTGTTIGSGIFDTVLFASTAGASIPAPQFQVNGGALTPTNFLLYDTELMIGGPGGGSTTQVYALNGSMQIAYYNSSTGHYSLDPSAWTAGTDTGETSQGIAVSYTTPGTGLLGAGPSIVEPLWNATPGGNQGRLELTGSVSPDNAFLFLSTGATFNATTAAWAPFVPGGKYTFYVPPGTYSGEALLANHDTRDVAYTGSAGTTVSAAISLPYDITVGIDTPLFAWNNQELANLSFGGSGTAASPYLLYNNEYTTLDPLFGEFNDFLFPVFPGVLIADTSAYFDLDHPAPFTVLYPSAYDARLFVNGLPDTNQLQIELYDTSHGSITDGGDIGGWMCGCQFNFPNPYYPDGEIVLWGATSTLVAGNAFQDQGVGIVLMQGSGNVVWGNEFLNGLLAPATYPAQFGIWEMESGDLIYNNAFDTSVTAFSPSYNLYNGNTQINRNAWNLSGWEPSSTVRVVNGFNLSGSLLGGPAVCGNWWWDYSPGMQLPYNEPYQGGAPFITTGGDYCPAGPNGTVGYPVTFTEEGLGGGAWTVTLAGVVATAAAGSPITFAMPNGTWSYMVGAVGGLEVSPAAGTVTVHGSGTGANIVFSRPVTATTPESFLTTVTEYGLPTGLAWSITINSTKYTENGTTVALTLINGSYPYAVAAVSDYSLLSAASGSILVNGAAASLDLHFAPDPGWLNATVSPATASVWVDGESVPLSSGSFTLEERPGTFAVVVTDSGYAPYYNNATVSAGTGTAIAVHLTAIGSSSPSGPGKSNGTATTSSGSSGLTDAQFYGLIGGLLAVAVAIVLAALLLRRRGSPPAPVPPAPDAGAPVEYAEPAPVADPTPGSPDVYYEGPPTDGAPPPRA
jgi:thermopsin